MKTREIAENIKISRLGVGCWSFGGGDYWGEQSQKEVGNIVNKAIDSGVNFFDTARMYNDGESEKSLGLALKNIRHKAVVCSKVSPAKAYYKILKRECEESLKNLGTDYLDIYMIHWPINNFGVKHFTDDPEIIANPPTISEAFAALADLKKEGKIKSIGVSNYGVSQLKQVLDLYPGLIEVNEVTYNIISRAIEAEILPFCKNNNISVITSMSLMQGVLTGKYNKIEDIPHNQAHSRHFKNERGMGTSRHFEDGAEEEIIEVLETIKEIALKLNISAAQVSVAWVFANNQVDCALLGSRNISELDENIKAAEITLPHDIISKINEISLPVLLKLGNNADYYENSKNSRIY
ncbi:MAG: aldo/keto reductase [Oscillospiraceae bacterium]|nr:aldo/keto reductase [Oscillospiraceae bacterium]